MRKPEIQPLIPLIRSRGQIPHPLLLRHRGPLGRPTLIPPHIVELGQDIEPDIQHGQRQQSAVPALVAGRVVGAVDVRCDDARGLHEHVVQGGGHGARAHCVGVAGVPRYLDGVGCVRGLR